MLQPLPEVFEDDDWQASSVMPKNSSSKKSGSVPSGKALSANVTLVTG
jgi:hypothetical protein